MIKNTINLIILALIALFSTSCAKMPPSRHVVKIDTRGYKASKPLSRSDKYLQCVIKLNRDGVKQDLIKILCDSSYGKLD